MLDFDQNALAEIIAEYKRTFAKHRPDEIYKWEAVKHFQENWQIQSDNFIEMLRKSLSKQLNLLTPYEYMGLIALARKDPLFLRNMFLQLFSDDNTLLAERVVRFLSSAKELANANTTTTLRHNQNERAISVYLFLYKPDEHYLYNRVGKFIKFAKKIKYSGRMDGTGIDKLISYYAMCDEILEIVRNDDELIMMSADSVRHSTDKYYQDAQYRLLADDIIWVSKQWDDNPTDWWPDEDEYTPGIDKDQWKQLWGNKTVFINDAKTVVSSFFAFENGATCTQVSQALGRTGEFYNANSVRLAQRVYMETNCELPPDESKAKWWPILYVGKSAAKDSAGVYLWKLRRELREALAELDIAAPALNEKNPYSLEKNIILHGPPGTGKTYNSINYAVSIIESKAVQEIQNEEYSEIYKRFLGYRNEHLIVFTTFHQSYGYEDFIEGIRPVITIDENTGGTENILYEVRDGIFKDFCESTLRGTKRSNDEVFDTAWEGLVNATKNNTGNEYSFTRRTGTKINAILIDNSKFRVNWQSDQNSYNDLHKGKIRDQWLSETNRESLSGGSRWLFDARQAVINELVSKYGLRYSNENAQKNRVFIIDEINRGNISKVFGELITLIEPSRRIGAPEELRSKLPYSGIEFGVPDNIYIIGTMNTADRSIAMMDTALRRRFSFIEMQPNPLALAGVDEVEGINISNMLDIMNARIAVLYDREHTIGHAYFISLKNDPSLAKLAEIFTKKIIPLLQEYFFEDYEKIRLVLGDNQKTDDTMQFVIKRRATEKLFGNKNVEIDDTEYYEINNDACMRVKAYEFLQ